MRIIGIDPGLSATGIGVVEASDSRCQHLHHAIVRTRASESLADRLCLIRDGVRAAAEAWGAEAGAVELSFVGTNAKSALALGHARAAALLGLLDARIAPGEYAPTVIKQTVTGYGRGEKAQVAEMVRLQLEMKALPTPADAADALAIAITHWAHLRQPQVLQWS